MLISHQNFQRFSHNVEKARSISWGDTDDVGDHKADFVPRKKVVCKAFNMDVTWLQSAFYQMPAH